MKKNSWPLIKIDRNGRKEYIYFVSNQEETKIKIGRTKNIQQRLKQMKTYFGGPPKLIALLNEMPEKFYQNLFAYDRISGGGTEMFVFSNVMKDYLNGLR